MAPWPASKASAARQGGAAAPRWRPSGAMKGGAAVHGALEEGSGAIGTVQRAKNRRPAASVRRGTRAWTGDGRGDKRGPGSRAPSATTKAVNPGRLPSPKRCHRCFQSGGGRGPVIAMACSRGPVGAESDNGRLRDASDGRGWSGATVQQRSVAKDPPFGGSWRRRIHGGWPAGPPRVRWRLPLSGQFRTARKGWAGTERRRGAGE